MNNLIKRILSGIKPTGKAHLGNYIGAIQNWVKLQEEHDCFFFIADLHALTTIYENPVNVAADRQELAIDLLAAGLDPDKCALFVQSELPEHAELHLLLSMITPLSWLERVPTYKDKMEEDKTHTLGSMYGFLGYPVLQAADILMYKADWVPVGKDQLPHIELTREIARRFNFMYGNVFPEPEGIITEFPLLPGTDGRKMSKSYNNTLPLSDPPEEMRKKILTMVTDTNRKRKSDPGNPDICPVFEYHKFFTPERERLQCAEGCRSAGIGCIDCKKILIGYIDIILAPYRTRRSELIAQPELITSALTKGKAKAHLVARYTLAETKRAIKLA